MVFHVNRRWLCPLTALLFAIGGMAQACAMTDAAMKLPSAAMECAASDHDMDCGGGSGDRTADAACVALCATAVAVLPALRVMTFAVVMQDVVAAAESQPSGDSPPPEPHPPKI
jgi:hypothetical protein